MDKHRLMPLYLTARREMVKRIEAGLSVADDMDKYQDVRLISVFYNEEYM